MFKITKCKDYKSSTVKKALNDIVKFSNFIRKGDKVLIKPNLLMATKPERLVTTNPKIVKAVIQEVKRLGGKPIIADSSGGPYNAGVLKRVYKETGMEKVSKETKAKLNFDNSTYELKNLKGFIKKYKLIGIHDKVNKVINLPKIKTHMLTTLTCATKNLFGLIPGTEKVSFHGRFKKANHFSEMLVDLAKLATSIKPTLTIVDGVECMEGEGPSNGTKKKLGVLIAGDNVFETDYNISKIIGMPYETIPYLKIALENKLFEKNNKKFTKYKKEFVKPHSSLLIRVWNALPAFAKNLVSNYWIKTPIIARNKCIGCGDCMRACPVKAIKIKEKKARIDYKNCIRCYCCHELCKYKAVDLKKKIL